MRNLLHFILILFCVTPALGQKIKTASGDISILAGETELSVSFGYENMQVHGYDSEEEFLKDKVKLREDRDPGSGETFRGAWFADRDSVFEPMFIEYINYKLPKKRKMAVSEGNANAKYNLHVQTLWVYPGYNVGFSQPAKIEVVMQLYDIANPEKILWESKSPTRIEALVVPTKHELRIGAAYMTLSMSVSWLLRREAK